MKAFKYIALAALTFSFAACTQDEDFIPQGDADAVKITATIGKLQTRVSYDERNTTFDENDQIKVVNKLRTSKNVAT
ncbi:MAG: fimbrillin family protein, partial [Bacteroidales bacterium]|nr:fimbrillin family protein [Bacteroidales bacterium]